MPVAQLAREVHLSVTPCLERVRHLEASGVIRGYHAELDPQRLGQQLLDDDFGEFVFALAELVMANMSVRVDKI